MVGAAVVGQTVVVERISEGMAPVAVVGADGGAYRVGLAFANHACAVVVHQVLLYACAGVVTGYEEKFHPWHFGFGMFGPFLAHIVPFGFFHMIVFHLLLIGGEHLLMDRLGQLAYPCQSSLARGGESQDESLQTRVMVLVAIVETDQFVERGTQHGDGSQQQDVPLGFGLAAVHGLLQEAGPPVFGEGRGQCLLFLSFSGQVFRSSDAGSIPGLLYGCIHWLLYGRLSRCIISIVYV